MKKLLIVSLMLLSLLSLAACGTTQGDTTDNSQAAADTTQDAQNDAQENTQKDGQEDGAIHPLPDELDINTLTSGDVAASFDANSLKEVDGQQQLSFVVYNYEQFDAADITALKEGDVLVLSGQKMTVSSVATSDGYITVNGGEEEGGVTFAPNDSGSAYYVMGMDNSKTYYEEGQLTFPVAESCVLTDDADYENPGQTTPASDLAKLLAENDVYGFNAQNTTVTILNGQITAIHRSYTP